MMSTTTDDVMGDSVLEHLEAECRVAMAKVAAIKVRGFDTQRERDTAMADLNYLLDAHNLLSAREG